MILLRRLLVGLSRKYQILPDTLFIEGVLCQDKYAIAGGGYADIYRAKYGGETVALKRFRTFATTSITTETKSVRVRQYIHNLQTDIFAEGNLL